MALSPQKPTKLKEKQTKWNLLLFDETDYLYIVFMAVYFLFSSGPCYFFSQSRNMYLFMKTKPDYQMVMS